MTELVILILIVGFVFLNGKIAKGKGYPFWAGAISGIIAFLGTILFLVLPSKIKKSLDDKNEELVRQQENSNSKQVKKKSKLLIILGAVLAVVIILYFYGTYLGKNDEKFNKNIVGTYSYSYTDKFEEGTTAKINGVKVFNSNGTCMDSAVWVVSIIDVYGNKSTLKYEIKSKGEYKIDPITDLLPVCPNCHMILHSNKNSQDGIYTPEQVKEMIRSNKKSFGGFR